ncbi:MAG: hypothetical protein CMF80_08075 [Candidatus Marinimicrobia bacterium]|nr:hypothetical protein [Candidatus Neomarinimicrobiota bacterium]|tara:strand:+ start:1136 stop:1699 length:564 start_codon:yes stop_codon:yes gene_type:complete
MEHNPKSNKLKKYNKILKKLNISHIVIDCDPYNHFHTQFLNEMNNENMFLLVIKNMSLGIIMNKNTAFRFDYIKNIVNTYSSYKTIFNYKIKIIELDENWDTLNWNYDILKRFHYMIQVTEKYRKPIDVYKNNYSGMYVNIDPYFLEALCWTIPVIENISPPVQTSVHDDMSFNNETYLEPMPYFMN